MRDLSNGCVGYSTCPPSGFVIIGWRIQRFTNNLIANDQLRPTVWPVFNAPNVATSDNVEASALASARPYGRWLRDVKRARD